MEPINNIKDKRPLKIRVFFLNLIKLLLEKLNLSDLKNKAKKNRVKIIIWNISNKLYIIKHLKVKNKIHMKINKSI